MPSLITNPLAPPAADSQTARRFLRHFGLLTYQQAQQSSLRGIDAARLIAERRSQQTSEVDPRHLALSAVAQAFSTLPYENLTRIIHYHHQRQAPFRTPEIVVGDHIADGTGGTCFSLTSALLHVVRWLGFDAEPLLADRRYGPNTHSALLVHIDGEPHLLDPGFLVNRPVPLREIASGGIELRTEFNRIVLRQESDERLQLLTRNNDQHETYRLTFKTSPADSGEFLEAWRVSFGSDILHKPVLTKVADGRQWFLNARRLQVRDQNSSRKRQLSDEELLVEIVGGFGLSDTIARRALDILQRQGDLPRTGGANATDFGGLPATGSTAERSNG